jgi:hypothetical protein
MIAIGIAQLLGNVGGTVSLLGPAQATPTKHRELSPLGQRFKLRM